MLFGFLLGRAEKHDFGAPKVPNMEAKSIKMEVGNLQNEVSKARLQKGSENERSGVLFWALSISGKRLRVDSRTIGGPFWNPRAPGAATSRAVQNFKTQSTQSTVH